MCVMVLVPTVEVGTPVLYDLKKVAKKFKNDPFSFVFAEVQRQAELAAALSVTVDGIDEENVATSSSTGTVTVLKFGKRTRRATIALPSSSAEKHISNFL